LHEKICSGNPGWPGLPGYVSHPSAFAGKKETLFALIPQRCFDALNDSFNTFYLSKKNLKTPFHE
jgi:hypothetical protein